MHPSILRGSLDGTRLQSDMELIFRCMNVSNTWMRVAYARSHHQVLRSRQAAVRFSSSITPRSCSVNVEESSLNGQFCTIPPPPRQKEQPVWTDSVWMQPLDVRRQIFCNRSLNMKQIKAVGFDMDYTLAQYRHDTFESLAYAKTINKLVTVFGYPSRLCELTFDWKYMTRGLIIDKKRGNVVKVDRHKYVKVGCHGFQPLTRQDRENMYHLHSGRESFDEPEYSMVDTLFSLAEAYLFMQLVEIMDKEPQVVLPVKSYEALYKDVRAAVDLCHRDGSLKKSVAADPSKYIHPDPLLPQLLTTLKKSGRKIFLATNSRWDYTNIVMNYLLMGHVGSKRTDEWLRYFDVVMTSCGKPAFFTAKQPLYIVETDTGKLVNTDSGAPIIPIDEEDLPRPDLGSSAAAIKGEKDDKAQVFQGGTYVDLHIMLGVQSGSEILYVGDHIYGDILRSKKSIGWRTMLVVPELEYELGKLESTKSAQQELHALRSQRDEVDDRIHRIKWALRSEEHGSDGPSSEALLAELTRQRDELKQLHRTLLKSHHESFHPVWGQLLKTGPQNSQFAHQLERFACLYTSHVSNMAYYSPDKSYSGRIDKLAHEDVFEGDQEGGLLNRGYHTTHGPHNGSCN